MSHFCPACRATFTFSLLWKCENNLFPSCKTTAAVLFVPKLTLVISQKKIKKKCLNSALTYFPASQVTGGCIYHSVKFLCTAKINVSLFVE